MTTTPVRVILPGLLRDLVGGVAEIEVAPAEDGQTVEQLLDAGIEQRAFARRVEVRRMSPHHAQVVGVQEPVGG